MSGDLAVQAPDVALARLRLADLERWIEAAHTVEDLVRAADTLRDAREWMRIKKVAGDVRAASARLEAIALRRIGQLGCDGLPMHSGAKSLAREFASLDDAEFDALLKRTRALTTPAAIWRIVKGERDRDQRHQYGQDFAAGLTRRAGPYGGGPDGNEELADRWDIAGAVRVVLRAASKQGERFTVAELSDGLVEYLRAELPAEGRVTEHPFLDDPEFRAGMKSIITHALTMENALMLAEARMPAYVTYRDGNDGWVRIPWDKGRLTELAQMAAFRSAQANQLARAAEDLNEIVDALDQVSRDNGDEQSLPALVSMFQRDTMTAILQDGDLR